MAKKATFRMGGSATGNSADGVDEVDEGHEGHEGDEGDEGALEPVEGIGVWDLGAGQKLHVPVYLKRPWPRNIPGISVGDCIGYVVLREGVDLNLLVDAVRSGFVSDTPPA